MAFLPGFNVGVNLGGWISQYPRFDHEHFKRFILEPDLQRIAGWGMDHVRLPVDYPVLEDDAAPLTYKEDGFAYIDACIEWCRKAGLNVILDLHHAPGFSFTTLAANTLFHNEQAQERFLALWEAIARRYKGVEKPALILELMNEVVLPDSAPWNALAARAVQRIRAVDPQATIMIGGNHYNSAWTLKDLDVLSDPRVVYTFHYYEPMPFTHQRAGWMESMVDFNAVLDYPAAIPGLQPFVEHNPQHLGQFANYIGRHMDLNMLRAFLQPAIDFMHNTGRPLYCGEYGAIDVSPLPSRLNWHRDFVGLLREHGIGRAVWSYKEMNFALVRDDGRTENEELIRIVSQR
ncbi:MAG: glycoside hydrolase family 5 protein [Anaerolineae bacterium]|nr:glycoside hydrolase family 5 protein [Anaerolineae bacterium]